MHSTVKVVCLLLLLSLIVRPSVQAPAQAHSTPGVSTATLLAADESKTGSGTG
jgi:hypothetical protein